ncbi:putative E3 ubiquitin-protein ligase BAH1-like 1 [Acorus calamus]|uniref:RING-type E3 ubiquitin transferase n=1 Tax=Acorus calamus TaxID=4465 RepID=A0AAV9D7V1_ACOCL|nr:putative E3 ubiquitin-protein ligase BAH1-like 1 [Acorus calamus]
MTFAEYLQQGEQEGFLNNCSHVEYKRLKKVLKSCRVCRAESRGEGEDDSGGGGGGEGASELCQCESYDQKTLVQEGRMLIDYITMNAIAIRKILKKYDKIHSSVNGRNFKTTLRAKHIELLQSPWLTELGAFCINSNNSDIGKSGEFIQQFSCDFSGAEPLMTLTLSNSVNLEYNLTCAVCLDTLFNPYALGCGHLFCKGCACSSASVFLFEGPKAAPKGAKCPVCRAVGVYANSVHLAELDLLLKNRCRDYWKERMQSERTEMVKQSKIYWESQTKFAIGYGH